MGLNDRIGVRVGYWVKGDPLPRSLATDVPHVPTGSGTT